MTIGTHQLSLDLSDAEAQQIRDALKLLQDKLVPRLVNLGPDERRGLPKMGDKTVSFVGKALDYAREHPQMRPPYIDMDAFARDWAAVELLLSMQRPLSQLVDMVDHSLLLAGSRAFSAGLACYRAVKDAARLKVPGAATIVDDLGQRFPGRTARGATPSKDAVDGQGNGAAAPRNAGIGA